MRVDYIKYKRSYPGKVTLTKHSLPESSKEENRFLFYDYNKYYFCHGLLARLLNGYNKCCVAKYLYFIVLYCPVLYFILLMCSNCAIKLWYGFFYGLR